MNLLKSSILIIALAAFALLGLTSCNKDDNPIDSEVLSMIQDDSYISFEEFAASDYKDATIEAEPELLTPEEDNYLESRPPQRPGEARPPRHPFQVFGPVFRAMEMSQDQLQSLRPYFEEHNGCVRELLIALRESEREILLAARQERAAILAQLRNEEITREEARELLQALNLETRTALRENPLREETRLALIACRETLLENIASILTEEQLEIWEEWLARREG